MGVGRESVRRSNLFHFLARFELLIDDLHEALNSFSACSNRSKIKEKKIADFSSSDVTCEAEYVTSSSSYYFSFFPIVCVL